MRFLFVLAVSLVAAAASGAESFVLRNGMRVVVDAQPRQPRVAIELWFPAGSGHEKPDQAGIAHLFEHAFPRSGVLNNPDNARRFREVLLDSNGQTRNDYTRYYLEVTSNGLDLALAYLAGRMAAPPESLIESDLDRHKEIVLAEMRNARGRPWDPEIIGPVREELWGPNHPYGHLVIGTETSVRRITLSELRAWFVDRYSPHGALLIVAGATSVAEVRESAERWFAPISRRGIGPRPLAEPMGRSSVARGGSMYWRGPGYGHPDADLFDLFLRVEAARLGVEPTVNLYEIGGEYSLRTNQRGLFGQPPSEQELAAAKAAFERQTLESLDRLGWLGSRIELLGEGMLFTGDPEFYLRRLARVKAVTVEDLVRATPRWSETIVVTSSHEDPRIPIGAFTPPELPRVQRGVIAGLKAIAAVRPGTSIAEIAVVNAGERSLDPLRKELLPIGGDVRKSGSRVVVTCAARHTTRALNAVRAWLRTEAAIIDQPDLADVVVGAPASPEAGLVIVSDRMPVMGAPRSSEASTAKPPLRPGGRRDVESADVRDTRLQIVIPFENASTAAAAQSLLRPRLQRLMREEKRWTYDVTSEVTPIGGWHVVAIRAVLAGTTAEEALAGAEGVVATAVQEAIDLTPIATALRRDLMNGIGTASSLSRLLSDLIYAPAPDPLAERWKEIETLSAESLRAAIAEATTRTIWLIERPAKR